MAKPSKSALFSKIAPKIDSKFGMIDELTIKLNLRKTIIIQSRPIKVRIFFIKMRVAESQPSCNIEES